jgi:hypothetical protein
MTPYLCHSERSEESLPLSDPSDRSDPSDYEHEYEYEYETDYEYEYEHEKEPARETLNPEPRTLYPIPGSYPLAPTPCSCLGARAAAKCCATFLKAAAISSISFSIMCSVIGTRQDVASTSSATGQRPGP